MPLLVRVRKASKTRRFCFEDAVDRSVEPTGLKRYPTSSLQVWHLYVGAVVPRSLSCTGVAGLLDGGHHHRVVLLRHRIERLAARVSDDRGQPGVTGVTSMPP
jgi:hypothetical protein